MDSCAQPGLIPLETALEQLLAGLQISAEIETRDLLSAAGAVLAEDIIAQVNLPPLPNSAMDGYALRISDLEFSHKLPVSQRIPAGVAPQPLHSGTVARIFTGAPVPEGADAVVMQEEAEVSADGRIRFPKKDQLKAQQHIRPQGEEIAIGEPVMARGTRLDAVAIGILASLGLSTVQVYRPLRVALLSTGDELLEPGQPAQAGKIYNSNRYLLLTLLKQLGFEPVDGGQVADTAAATEQALNTAAAQADVILTTGGVSVGEEDHVKHAIEHLGELNLWRIRIKPGKPFAAGRIGTTPLFGLPGNPSSAFVTFLLLALPCLRKLQGQALAARVEFAVSCDFELTKARGRDEFLRVRCDGKTAQLHPKQSSGMLLPLFESEGLLRVPAGTTVARGDQLIFTPFASLMLA